MKAKVFEMPGKAKVMVIDNEEFVEYYLQINSSNWSFCVGCKEDFDKVTEEDAKMIWDEYYDYVDEDEKVLEKHAEETLDYWDKFKKVVGYGFNDFEGEGYTSVVFNIDDETNIGCIYIAEEDKELFDDTGFVNYFLAKVNKGHCNNRKRKALKIVSIDESDLYSNKMKLSVQFA